ncbi:hypothetical protein [Streptomyces boninensis]|uniref:hypothetical protein n=1 Tax=Streptomyces boninensis TaxID=2039455 RepID=UPI003B21A712
MKRTGISEDSVPDDDALDDDELDALYDGPPPPIQPWFAPLMGTLVFLPLWCVAFYLAALTVFATDPCNPAPCTELYAAIDRLWWAWRLAPAPLVLAWLLTPWRRAHAVRILLSFLAPAALVTAYALLIDLPPAV